MVTKLKKGRIWLFDVEKSLLTSLYSKTCISFHWMELDRYRVFYESANLKEYRDTDRKVLWPFSQHSFLFRHFTFHPVSVFNLSHQALPPPLRDIFFNSFTIFTLGHPRLFQVLKPLPFWYGSLRRWLKGSTSLEVVNLPLQEVTFFCAPLPYSQSKRKPSQQITISATNIGNRGYIMHDCYLFHSCTEERDPT